MIKASVIIPTFNRKKLLQLSLLSLARQEISTDHFEVIIIDDGSTDGTIDMIQKMDLNYPLQVLRNEDNKGAAFARNKGINRARGDLIIFSDSDLIVPSNFISGHLDCHQEDCKLVVSCVFRWKKIFTYYFQSFSQAQQEDFKYACQTSPAFSQRLEELNFSYADGEQIVRVEDIADIEKFNFIPSWSEDYLGAIVTKYGYNLTGFAFPWVLFGTGNSSVRKTHLHAVGGFDEQMRREEDWELGYRLFKAGLHFKTSVAMESAHQEHPIVSHRLENMIEGYKVFFSKHSDPLLRLIVLHLENLFDWIMLSEAVKEYRLLEKDPAYEMIIDRFNELATKRGFFFLTGQKGKDISFNIGKELEILYPIKEKISTFLIVFQELARNFGDLG